MRGALREGVAAGLWGAALGGIPSTAWALAKGHDPLEPTLAAGSILLPRERRRTRLAAAAVPVHLAVSLAWGVVLARVLPRRPGAVSGALAGLAIAAVDLGPAARPFPRVRALPLRPQLADHAAFGVVVALALRRRR